MLEMADKQIIPAVMGFSNRLAGGIASKKSIGLDAQREMSQLEKIESEFGKMMDYRDQIEDAISREPAGMLEAGLYINDTIKPLMDGCRKAADQLENLIDKSEWPFPDYTDILFYI